MNNIVNELLKEIIQNSIILEKKESPLKAKEGEAEAVPPIRWPKFEISEMWGKKTGGEDRGIIEQISESVKGNTVQEKITLLQAFLDAKTEEITAGDVSLNEVIANLMFLEVFASVVFKFNASVAGFLFEALFAGVFSGYQIEAAEADDPTDAVLNISGTDVDYSFKLLSPGGNVKGSFSDLVNMFTALPKDENDKPIPGGKPKSRIVYLVVEKVPVDEGLRLDFYEFEINKDNWFDFIGHEQLGKEGVAKIRKEKVPLVFTTADFEDPEFKVSGILTPAAGPKVSKQNKIALGENPEGDKLESGTPLEPGQTYSTMTTRELTGAAAIKRSANFDKLYTKAGIENLDFGDMDFYTYITKGPGDRAPYQDDPDFFEKLKDLTSYGTGVGAGQFLIGANHYKQKLSKPAVSLTLGRERLFAAANNYTQVIGEQVGAIFNALSALVGGVNGYFLSAEPDKRKQSGKLAVDKAGELKETTDAYIKRQEAEAAAETAKAHRMSAERAKQRKELGAPTRESKQPINLNKLIEQMFNKKFN